MSWEAIVVLVFGSYGCKAFGVFVLSRFADEGGAMATGPRRWLPDTAALIPAALFSALILVQTFDVDGSLQIDARAAGLAAGVVAVWRKAPFIVVVLLSMAVTAALRWQT